MIITIINIIIKILFIAKYINDLINIYLLNHKGYL